MTAAVVAMAPSPLSDEAPGGLVTGKRKRSSEPAEALSSRVEIDTTGLPAKEHGLDEFLVDVLDILRSHDPNPSILRHHLTDQTENPPSAKRARLSTPASHNQTIEGKVASATYRTVTEFTEDVSTTVTALASSTSQPNKERFEAFQAIYNEILARQKAQNGVSVGIPLKKGTGTEIDGSSIKFEDSADAVWPSSSTLSFAGPAGRPYFSSLRKESPADPAVNGENNVTPVLEMVLPKGMWTSTIVPIRSRDGESSSKKIPTIGEICPKPAHLALLEPPRESPIAVTRGSIVGWYQPAKFPSSRMRVSGRQSYSNQKLSAGTWLSNRVMPLQPANQLDERRRPKDPGLNNGDTQSQKQTEQDREEAKIMKRQFKRKKNIAMIKGVYSSFAPSFDNTNATIPQEQRRQLWWNKKTTLQRQSPQSVDAHQQYDAHEIDAMASADYIDEKGLEEAIREFDETEEDPWAADAPAKDTLIAQPLSNQDTEEILADISEMLETLSSHQRNRHIALQPKRASADGNGSPSKPSSAEFDLHGMLRDQLAVLVSSLPPFAVARLDGDRLKELNISTTLEMEDAVYNGLLEEEPRPHLYQASGSAATPNARHTSVSAARPNVYAGGIASPGTRNSFSTARPSSSYYSPSTRPPGAGSYTTYQHHTQGPPRPQHPAYNQNAMISQGTMSAERMRVNPSPNGYLSQASSSTSRAPPYQTAMQTYPQGGHQQPLHAGNHMLSHGRGASPPQPPSGQPGRPSSAHMSPPQQSYSPYSAGATASRSSQLSNGVGTIGAQIHMSPEERALIASRQRQTPQQTSSRPHQSDSANQANQASPLKPPVNTPQNQTIHPPPGSLGDKNITRLQNGAPDEQGK